MKFPRAGLVWPLYPEAEEVPWAFPSQAGGKIGAPTYYKDAMNLNSPPIAGVQHIAEGYATTARQWATTGFYPKSWHYTFSGDHTWEHHACPYRTCPKTEPYIMQHLRLQDGGYHAGVRDSQTREHPPTWKLWRGVGINVNKYTYGVEVEGFVAPNGRLEYSPKILAMLRDLHRWHAEVLGYELAYDRVPPHADIDVINRVNDFDYPSERHHFYDYILGDSDMGMTAAERDEFESLKAELDRLRTAVYAGSERFHMEEEKRVVDSFEARSILAKFTMTQAADGAIQSMNDQAASANAVVGQHIDDHGE